MTTKKATTNTTTNTDLAQKIDKLTDAVLKLVEVQTPKVDTIWTPDGFVPAQAQKIPKKPAKRPAAKKKQRGRPKGSKNKTKVPAIEIATEIPAEISEEGVDSPPQSAIIQSGRMPNTRVPKRQNGQPSSSVENPATQSKQCRTTGFDTRQRQNKFVEFAGGQECLDNEEPADKSIDKALWSNRQPIQRGSRAQQIVEAQCKRCLNIFDVNANFVEQDPETHQYMFFCDNCTGR